MDINNIMPGIQELQNVLKEANTEVIELADKLIKVAAEETIDASRLEAMGDIIDLYV